MGRECKEFYRRLAEMISSVRGTGYSITVERSRSHLQNW